MSFPFIAVDDITDVLEGKPLKEQAELMLGMILNAQSKTEARTIVDYLRNILQNKPRVWDDLNEAVRHILRVKIFTPTVVPDVIVEELNKLRVEYEKFSSTNLT